MSHPLSNPTYHTVADIKALRPSSVTVIYALCDPDTHQIRYVGKSVRLYKRLCAHVSRSRTKVTKCHSSCWIRGLLDQGKLPVISILETIPVEVSDSWEDRETYWISRLRAEGHDLTNISEGGEGCASYGRLGKKNSPEHIEKSSSARRGKPFDNSAWKDKMIAGRRQYVKRSQENGISLSWGHHTDESKAKISASNKGRPKPIKPENLAAHRARTAALGKASAVSVDCLALDYSLIHTYPSIVKASLDTGVGCTSIANCLAGRSLRAGPYRWRYHDQSHE